MFANLSYKETAMNIITSPREQPPNSTVTSLVANLEDLRTVVGGVSNRSQRLARDMEVYKDQTEQVRQLWLTQKESLQNEILTQMGVYNEALRQEIGDLSNRMDSKMEKMGDQIERKIGNVRQEIGDLSNRMDSKMEKMGDQIERKIGNVRQEIGDLSNRMDSKMEKMGDQIERICAILEKKF